MKRFFLFVAFVCLAATANAQILLKQSTATTVNGKLTKIADGTDHTGLTVTSITAKIIKQSDTTSSTVTAVTCAASGSANDCVEISAGMYNIELSASNTDTVGRLDVCMLASGDYTDCVRYEVVPSGYYDLAVTTGPTSAPTNFPSLSINASGQVDIAKILGTAISTPATAGVLDVNAKNINNAAAPTITGDAYARLGAPTGASIAADILTRGTHAVKRNTGFQWGIQMMTSAGVAVTTGTPVCTRAIDSTTFAATTNSPAALSADGFTELILSNGDMNGTDYVILKCTVATARNYYTIFKLEAP